MQETQETPNTKVIKEFDPKTRKMIAIFWLVILGLGILAALVYFVALPNKKMFVVGRVNGQFISRMELDKAIFDNYSQTAFQELVTRKLVEAELKKANVQVSKEDYDKRVKQIEQGFAGQTLDEVLKAQNMTRASFDSLVTLQLGSEKLLKDKVTITDEEIADFIKQYPTALTATDDQGKKDEAKEYIFSQKVNEERNTWVQDLLAKAKVDKYL